MENAIFLITHLITTVCCLVIFGIGINSGKEKTFQIERKKKTTLYAPGADDLTNEIIPAENVIDGPGFQLAAN